MDVMQDMVEISLEQFNEIKVEIESARKYANKFEILKVIVAKYYDLNADDIISVTALPSPTGDKNRYLPPIINVEFKPGCEPRSVEDIILEDGTLDAEHLFVTEVLHNNHIFNYEWSYVSCVHPNAPSMSMSTRDLKQYRELEFGRLLFDGAYWRELLSRAVMFAASDLLPKNKAASLADRNRTYHLTPMSVSVPRIFRLTEVEAPVFETF